jgi:hypothetical protein
MSVRQALRTVTAVVATLCPLPALAQSAWSPAKGEAAITANYQWLVADRHLFSNLTGPELTPMEIEHGIDYQSNSLDLGTVQSHALVVDGLVGLTERLALSGSIAFIAARYRGAYPENDVFDNTGFHGAVQDAQLGARYSMTRDLWTLTPFTDFVFPVSDYEVTAHAAHGLGLTMLEVGTSVGRILLSDGAAKGYLQGTVGYAFTRTPGELGDLSLNRSRATLEGGYFLGRFSLQGLTVWRRVHGGIEWFTLHHHSDHTHFAGHDQAAAIRDWRYVAGVSFQMSDAMSLEMSYGDFLRGANTHAARVMTVGWSWGFRAFGVPTLGGGFR